MCWSRTPSAAIIPGFSAISILTLRTYTIVGVTYGTAVLGRAEADSAHIIGVFRIDGGAAAVWTSDSEVDAHCFVLVLVLVFR